VGSSGALESGGAPPQSGTLSRTPRATAQRHESRITHYALPRISPLLLQWFTWYCRGYIGRHFHSIRVSINGSPPDVAGLPLVVFTNHASWWDPLVGLVMKDEYFRDRNLYAPIDAAMLERYRMFAKLGFFGVEQGTRRGAVQFLRTSEAILSRADSLLAITPQSRFADVRQRPLRFQSGLGRVAAHVKNVVFLPMATEFVFWEERLPEILVRFGEPVMVTHGGPSPSRQFLDCGAAAPLSTARDGLRLKRALQDAVTKEAAAAASNLTAFEWTEILEQRLSETLDALSAEARSRHPSDFRTILRGGAGQGGVYDLWRRVKAMWRGETFVKEHGCR
jgi:1-acyl-sn-glycerol-3-phosphate acyltransferase